MKTSVKFLSLAMLGLSSQAFANNSPAQQDILSCIFAAIPACATAGTEQEIMTCIEDAITECMSGG